MDDRKKRDWRRRVKSKTVLINEEGTDNDKTGD